MSVEIMKDLVSFILDVWFFDDLLSGSVNVSDFWVLICKVEVVFDLIEGVESLLLIVQKFVEGLIVVLGVEMGIYGGCFYVYDEDDDEYFIWSLFGGVVLVEWGYFVLVDYLLICSCFEQGVVYMKCDDLFFDREYEDLIGVGIFVVVLIFDGNFFIVVDFELDYCCDDIFFILGLLCYGINDCLCIDCI